jgi:DNA-binding transcriptional LysR family regulator
MTNLLYLETFVAAATTGSFANAAKLLQLTPAMVGRRIQALEDELGTKLIERSTRRQRLTDVGAKILEKASGILAGMDALKEVATGEMGELSGRLRISAPITLGIRRLAPMIAEFGSTHPKVTIEMCLSDRNVDLVSEGFDLAVRVGNLQSSSLIARRVGTYDFACCASPKYLGGYGTPETLSDLGRAKCILNLNLSPRDRWPFLSPEGQMSVEVRGNIEADNGEALRAAALADGGVIYAPRMLVEDDLQSGALVEVLGHLKKHTLPINVVRTSREFQPVRTRAFIEAVSETIERKSDMAPSP